jgi:hypothetical protein
VEAGFYAWPLHAIDPRRVSANISEIRAQGTVDVMHGPHNLRTSPHQHHVGHGFPSERCVEQTTCAGT